MGCFGTKSSQVVVVTSRQLQVTIGLTVVRFADISDYQVV